MEEIRPLRDAAEARACAAMMAATDPWRTLEADFDRCYAAVTRDGREVYVAIDDGAIAGLIIIDMRGPLAGYIATICVAAGARGRGVGTRLIAFAEQRIFRESPNAFLMVSDFNRRARALYERLGYHFVGEITDFIRRGRSELLMRKTLGPIGEFEVPLAADSTRPESGGEPPHS